MVIDKAGARNDSIERGVTTRMTGLKCERWPLRLAGRWIRQAMLATILLVGGLAGAAQAMAESPRQLVYDVKHSVFGDIGTYTNTIESSGNTVTIKTAAHFLVKAMGIGLHREDAERVEQWQGNRLVFFHGITVKNGEKTEVSGKAAGNNFVINSPAGTVNAPGDVKPANPWSTRSIESHEMMRVDSGKVEKVTVSGGGQTNVNVDGASTTAKEYDITGSTKYKVFFDSHDVPVMFVVDDDSGQVTFTLKK